MASSQVAFGIGSGVLGNLVTNAAGAEILDTATATAKAGTDATAEAFAGGIYQYADFASVIGNAVFNSGLIDVNAHAKAVGGHRLRCRLWLWRGSGRLRAWCRAQPHSALASIR